MDGGAWWAAIYGAAQSWTQLKQLSSSSSSLEGMMLKLKLQYIGHLMGKVDSLEKTLIQEGLGAGGEGDDRE